MNITVEMPNVEKCQVGECVYNKNFSCNARAITVGDGIEPRCDTYYVAAEHTRKRQGAGVGACKVSSCHFNEDYECQADKIIIGNIDNIAVCKTWQAL